jgi:hypothetical protein
MCLHNIYSANPAHKYLVDAQDRVRWPIRGSLHTMSENAVAVTKEEKVTALNSKKIKIPNICDNMNICWINDFQMINELGIRFTCKIGED